MCFGVANGNVGDVDWAADGPSSEYTVCCFAQRRSRSLLGRHERPSTRVRLCASAGREWCAVQGLLAAFSR